MSEFSDVIKADQARQRRTHHLATSQYLDTVVEYQTALLESETLSVEGKGYRPSIKQSILDNQQDIINLQKMLITKLERVQHLISLENSYHV